MAYPTSRRWWTPLPGGGYYPFELRAERFAILHAMGQWQGLETMYAGDLALAEANGIEPFQAYYLWKLGELNGMRNRLPEAAQLLARSRELFHQLGDAKGMRVCDNGLAFVHVANGEYDRAETIMRRYLSDAERRGNEYQVCQVLGNLAIVCKRRGRIDQAQSLQERRMALSIRLGLLNDIGITHVNLGDLLIIQNRYPEAIDRLRQAITVSQRTGDLFMRFYAMDKLGHVYLTMDLRGQAFDCLHQALAMAQQLGDQQGAESIIGELARLDPEGSNGTMQTALPTTPTRQP